MTPPADRARPTEDTLDRIRGPLDLARAWAGGDRLALILSGSHASGEAVWVTHEEREISLSDLDCYAVVRDREAKRAARARAAQARPGLASRLLATGLAAPLEVGFYTPEDLAALPARPGTLALRRAGRVLEGDPALLARVPAWSARDVSREEVWLLLENRAFELLWAEAAPEAEPRLAALQNLRRRHAVLKCALDLASVMALAAGEYPEDAPARVAWARERWDRSRAPEPPWAEALAWREGRTALLAPGAARAEWLRTVTAWIAVWRTLAGDAGDPGKPFEAIGRVARRAPLARRLRRAWLPDASDAGLERRPRRLRRGLGGTSRHRLHAAAAAHLVWEAARAGPAGPGAGGRDALERSYRDLLRGLGFPLDPAGAARWLVCAWDRRALDGQRTEGWA